MLNFEPVIAPGVPQGLAKLLYALLAVSPAARPTAQGARLALASLAADSVSWPTDRGALLPPLAGHPSAATLTPVGELHE